MKHISEQNVEQCLEIMDKLCKYKTASLYMNPVEPRRDNCPDYFDIISNPMDFSTVRLKLTSKSYSTINEWKRDVNLIFNNSKAYNSKDSLYGITAQFLQKKFNEMIKYFSEDGWSKKLDFLQDHIKNLVQNAPFSLPSPYLSIEEIESRRSQLFSSVNIHKKVINHKNSIQSNNSNAPKRTNQNNANINLEIVKKSSSTNMPVIPKKINVSNQNDSRIIKQIHPNKSENQNISSNILMSNQNTVKKYYLYDQSNSNAISKQNKPNDQNISFNSYNSINDNSINKNAVNRVSINHVSLNSINNNDDSRDKRKYVQRTNYTNINQEYQRPIINNNNNNTIKIINNRNESNDNNSNITLENNTNNISIPNIYNLNRNSSGDMNNYGNSYRSRISRNNDSDSSDNIFVLDD